MSSSVIAPDRPFDLSRLIRQSQYAFSDEGSEDLVDVPVLSDRRRPTGKTEELVNVDLTDLRQRRSGSCGLRVAVSLEAFLRAFDSQHLRVHGSGGNVTHVVRDRPL